MNEKRDDESDIVDQAAAALRGEPVPDGPPGRLVQATLQAVERRRARDGRGGWKERILRMFSRGKGSAAGAPFWSARRFGALAAAVVIINVAGLIWIHHDLVGGRRQKIRVLSALPPAGEVEQADRFVLLFDEPLAAGDAVGGPAERVPFVVNPQPPGHWRWAAPDRLEFVLDERLPPGRMYTIRPAMDFELLTGRQVVGPSEFSFRTRPLVLERCKLETANREHVNFELKFNQPVRPAEVLEHLVVSDARSGAELNAVSLVQEPADSIILRAARPGHDRMRILLKRGLKGDGAQLGLDEDIWQSFEVPKRLSLLRAEVSVPSLKEDITVRLELSEQLDRSVPVPKVSVSPAVEGLRVTRYEQSLVLIGPFECGKRYAATIEGVVLSASGQALEDNQSISFEIPDRRPGVRFAVSRGILSSRGRLCMDLKAVNVSQLWFDAHRVHANNLVHHLKGYADASRKVAHKTFKVDCPRNAPTRCTVDLRSLMDMPAGIYRLHVGQTGSGWWHDSAVVAVTDLGMTAKRHKEGYLVWVTSISTAEPVAGAKVSALTHNNQTVATATTDEDGVALLRVNFDHPDGPAWAITAERGGELSFIVPEGHEWFLDDVDVSGRKRTDTYEVVLYGDRGVYRPGETIHVTGIIRDADGAIPPAFPLTIT
ncbi:MAG TPA: MG2 domain-containing protein, partial [Phycisphaerae bacterium]|nr:MG2 domain-containing protein [Phycisphaerae bacterium]